jgi:RHS repeat-associated protein
VIRLAGQDNGEIDVEHVFHGALGSLLAAVDRNGEGTARFGYGPFGEVLYAEGAAMQNYDRRFNGKQSDELSQLRYYGARYYDPLTLSWTQADPLYRFVPEMALDEPMRQALYAFSLNNPLSYIDPDGRDPTPGPKPMTADEVKRFCQGKSSKCGKTKGTTPMGTVPAQTTKEGSPSRPGTACCGGRVKLDLPPGWKPATVHVHLLDAQGNSVRGGHIKVRLRLEDPASDEVAVETTVAEAVGPNGSAVIVQEDVTVKTEATGYGWAEVTNLSSGPVVGGGSFRVLFGTDDGFKPGSEATIHIIDQAGNFSFEVTEMGGRLSSGWGAYTDMQSGVIDPALGKRITDAVYEGRALAQVRPPPHHPPYIDRNRVGP